MPACRTWAGPRLAAFLEKQVSLGPASLGFGLALVRRTSDVLAESELPARVPREARFSHNDSDNEQRSRAALGLQALVHCDLAKSSQLKCKAISCLEAQVGVNSVNPTDAWVLHSDLSLDPSPPSTCSQSGVWKVWPQVALEMAETSEHGGSSIQDEEVGWIAVQQGAHSFLAATGGILHSWHLA